MRQNSVLDLLSEAVGQNLQFHKLDEGSDVPVEVKQVVSHWLEERRINAENCIEVWRGSFGLDVNKSFYIYRYYIAAMYATSISLLIRDALIVGESHHLLD